MIRRILLIVSCTITVFWLAACGGSAPAGTPTRTLPPLAATAVNATAGAANQVSAVGRYTNVTPALLNQMLAAKDFLLVNVHVPYAGELAQTDLFIPYTDIERDVAKLPTEKGAKIVFYCSSGHMSGIAAQKLVQLGYTNVWDLVGGMTAWEKAGYQVIQKTR